MESHLHKFNSSLRDFIEDLRNVVDPTTPPFRAIESVVDITKINARIVIVYFQQTVLQPPFMENILGEDADFFINYSYDEYVGNNTYGTNLMERLKGIVKSLRDENKTQAIRSIFGWLKIMIYHSLHDLGLNAKEEMRRRTPAPSSWSVVA